jgi:transcriptional regulator with XRE-family HTH domain
MELRTARKLARLTHLQLADRAGVDNTAISKIENGERDIYGMSYSSVIRLARALGVEAEELWPVPPLPAPTNPPALPKGER